MLKFFSVFTFVMTNLKKKFKSLIIFFQLYSIVLVPIFSLFHLKNWIFFQVYFESDCASDELISQCRSYIALALRTPIDTDSDFQSLLKLIRIYSSKNFDQVEIILADNETNSWSELAFLFYKNLALKNFQTQWKFYQFYVQLAAHKDGIYWKIRLSMNLDLQYHRLQKSVI